MKPIDSGALELLNRVFRIPGGSPGAKLETELDDEHVSSVLDLSPVIRRSLALAGTGGIGFGLLRALGGAGEDHVSVTLDPYAPGIDAVPPYPGTVGPGFDFWMIGAGLSLESGTPANFNESVLSLSLGTNQLGWGRDQAGSPVSTGTGILCLARWDDMDDTNTPATIGVMEDGSTYARINLRVRRGMTIRYDQQSSNAVETNCIIYYALLPVALGQDVAT